jgi:hypothetical protein
VNVILSAAKNLVGLAVRLRFFAALSSDRFGACSTRGGADGTGNGSPTDGTVANTGASP